MIEAGDPVHCRMTKWGDRPHWEFDGVVLGADDHGTWLGIPAGTHHSRPGLAFDSDVDSVTLVAPDAWTLPTFHAPGIWCDLYVDVATPATWRTSSSGTAPSGPELTAVDLDLDVIRVTERFDSSEHPYLTARGISLTPGDAFIDDEDEFTEHQLAYGYPADVVARVRRAADETLAAVRSGTGPYDGSHQRWLDALARG